MKHILFLLLMLSFNALASDSPISVRDTIPDSTHQIPPSGLTASGISLGTGAGATLFGIFGVTQALNGKFDDKAGIFAIGIVVGLAAVISGITSLTKRSRLVKAGYPASEKDNIQRTKKQAITGIILGILGIAASIFAIAISTGVMGF